MFLGTCAKPPIIFRRYEFRAPNTNNLRILRSSHLPNVTFVINYCLQTSVARRELACNFSSLRVAIHTAPPTGLIVLSGPKTRTI